MPIASEELETELSLLGFQHPFHCPRTGHPTRTRAPGSDHVTAGARHPTPSHIEKPSVNLCVAVSSARGLCSECGPDRHPTRRSHSRSMSPSEPIHSVAWQETVVPTYEPTAAHRRLREALISASHPGLKRRVERKFLSLAARPVPFPVDHSDSVRSRGWPRHVVTVGVAPPRTEAADGAGVAPD